MSDFANRLRKVARHREKWARRQGLSAYRVYDFDVPGWPVVVDRYGALVHVGEYPRGPSMREALVADVEAALEVPAQDIFVKTHLPRARSEQQYQRLGDASRTVTVTEHGLSFECNLSDYLDTGLFIDHRLTRARVRDEVKGRRFLNLFAYTGSFTVYALDGEARSSVTVDLSPTYGAWARRNLALNGFAFTGAHELVSADVLAWVERAPPRSFDVIVLDPPSFSTSKKMGRRFEVQRDHRHLLGAVQALLAPGGVLYFSTNFAGFSLDPRVGPAEEVTALPEDCRRPWHRCFRLGPG